MKYYADVDPYELELHEEKEGIIRVPGGWLYTNLEDTQVCFVPYSPKPISPLLAKTELRPESLFAEKMRDFKEERWRSLYGT